MIYQWQYNGRVPMDEIVRWCNLNIGPPGKRRKRWAVSWETIYFYREKDYTLFLLKWA